MAVKNKRVTIDGHEYEITQLGALDGRKVWLKLLQSIAAPLKVLGAADTLDEKTFATVIAAAVEGLDEATVESLYEAYGARCTVRNGERWPTLDGAVFDQHFAGQYLSMSKWLLECTLFNFAGFLGDTSLGSLTGNLQAMMTKAKGSSSPKDSTGTSGESSPTNEPP